MRLAGAQGRLPCCSAWRHRRRISAETAGPDVRAVKWIKHLMSQLLCGFLLIAVCLLVSPEVGS